MRRRRTMLMAALAVGSAAAALLTTNAGAGPSAPSYGIPVVAHFWTPGFEPDVAQDKSPGTHPIYTTWPNGFSTTISYAARSDDGGRSFHFVEGNIIGKPLTCAGGGDSELQVSPVDGKLYFADLQGLTDFATSTSADHGKHWNTTCVGVNDPAVDRQWIALDTNGGTSAVGSGANDGRAYLTYDNIAQDPNQNALVMNESVDGVYYGSGCATAGIPCPGEPTVITASEGLPGNTLVDNTKGGSFQHSVYVAHNNDDGDAAILSYCRGPATGPKTAATVADVCSKPPANPLAQSPDWHDVYVRPADDKVTVEAFVVVAIDTAGNLYMTWAEFPFNPDDNTIKKGGGSVMLATSTNGGVTWTKPVRVNPTSLKTPVFPWIAAGDPGRVDIAYYAAPEEGEKNADGDLIYGPDAITQTGTWQLYLDQSLNALSGHPSFTHTQVSDHQVKWGNISTQGLGGSSDRSLGDYMQVQVGRQGEALLSYVDDTSENRNPDFTHGSGQSPAEAAGPTMVAVQTGGPSLYKSVGTITGDDRRPYGKVGDPVGTGFPDAYYGVLGNDTNAPKALDIGGVTVTQADSEHLRITMSTGDTDLANNLSSSLSLGGSTADWIVRWAAPSYHKPNGNGGYIGDGDMFYVGMESTNGGSPKYFTGSTDSLNTTHAKYFIYTPKKPVPGSIKGNTITWTVPLSDVGNPPKGAGLYSVTGFTSTQLLPSEPTVSLINGGVLTAYTPPNLIDAAQPTEYRIGKLTPNIPGSLKPPGNNGGGGNLATTGLPVTLPFVGLGLLALTLAIRRHQRRAHTATR